MGFYKKLPHWRYLKCPSDLLIEINDHISLSDCWDEHDRAILLELSYLARSAILARVELNTHKNKYAIRKWTN